MKLKLLTINLMLILLAISGINGQTSLHFDGINDAVDCGDSSIFNISGQLTIEAYVQQNSSQNWPSIAGNFEDSSNYWKGYWLGADDLGHASFFVGKSSSSYDGYWLVSNSIIADSNWHHLAGVYSNDTAKLYVDGILEVTSYTPNANLYSTENFRIGNDIFSEAFLGNIDDVRLWNTNLSATQILMYKDSCLTGTENNLLAYYHFEISINSNSVHDLTPNGNNGTLLNMDTVNSWVSGINCIKCDFVASTEDSITVTGCGSYTSPSGNYIWTTSNTYVDTIPNAAGCDSIITVVLTINTVDTSTTVTGFTISSNASGASYQWINCITMTAISGETSQSFTATANGDYAVIVTENGCTDTSACVTINGVGIIEKNLGSELVVFPNPTDGYFAIDLGKKYYKIKTSITDINGKLIQNYYFYQNQFQYLNIEEPCGIYFIKIDTGVDYAIIRLIKE